MVRQVVQAAVRNYFASSCTALARLTLCLDFTEGAPVPNNKTPFVRYQAPLVQISVERKSGPGSTTTAQSTTLRAAAKSSEKAQQRTPETRKNGPLLEAAKKLGAVSTIKEEDEVKPTKAVVKNLEPQVLQQHVEYLKCAEKKVAEEKTFDYLTLSYKRLMSQEMIDEWRQRYEEDKRELYTDTQPTPTQATSSPMTTQSEVKSDMGTITEDQQTSGWGPVTGTIEFEPKNERGWSSKGIQVRGNLSSLL